MALVSIILPTHSNSLLLPLAVESIKLQTIKDWELFIIGDGPSNEVQKVAERLEEQNRNINFHNFQKSTNVGEFYRHEIITRNATGRYILYLSDEDLWMPTHIAGVLNILRENDFAHAQFLRFKDKENLEILNSDLNLNYYRKLILSGENRIPLSCVGHTIEIYQSLEKGWDKTPENISAETFMWQKFLKLKDLKACSTEVPSVLNFPNGYRLDWKELERKNEMEEWLDKLSYVDSIPLLMEMYIKALHDHTNQFEVSLNKEITKAERNTLKQVNEVRKELDLIKSSKTWKLQKLLSKITG